MLYWIDCNLVLGLALNFLQQIVISEMILRNGSNM